MTERSGTTGVAPEPGERRMRCWNDDCRAWYSLPEPDPPTARTVSAWPQYAGVFIGVHLCPTCAEARYQQRMKERQDGCH